jgi:phosphoserine phosphatase RsbU/P
MARAISLLQYLGDELDPAWAMARLNDALEDGNDNCMFVTLFIGRLALDTGELVFASAGHPPPMLLRDGAATELPQEAGPAIGLRAGLVFEQCRAQLRQGDRLTLYTDGVDEAFSTAREMFGLQRLQQSLQRSAGQNVVATVDAVFDAVAGFVAGAAQSDDITLLVLDWQAPPFMQAAKFRPGPRLVSRALDWIQDAAEPLQLSEDQRFTLFLLLEETVANIDQYAGLSTEQRIDVELVADSRALELRISDPGAAFNPLLESSGAELGLPTEQAPAGGLGVHLIRKLGDRHHYRRAHGRNILTLTLSRRNRGD